MSWRLQALCALKLLYWVTKICRVVTTTTTTAAVAALTGFSVVFPQL
jgi:hypothetical protein